MFLHYESTFHVVRNLFSGFFLISSILGNCYCYICSDTIINNSVVLYLKAEFEHFVKSRNMEVTSNISSCGDLNTVNNAAFTPALFPF